MTGTYRENQPHLWDRVPKGRRSGVTPVKGEHEGRCTVCGARVTTDPGKGTEYGHRYNCPHRPENLPRTSGGGSSGHCSEYVCPTCGRGDFDSEAAMKLHHTHAHGERLRDEATCPVCEETFEKSKSDQTYCSQDCFTRSRRKRVTLSCVGCGDEFETTESLADSRRYCSQACQADDRRERDTRACPICETEFECLPSNDKTYCSTDCRDEAQRDRLVKDCRHCGDEFETPPSKDRIYCSEACGYADKKTADERTCPTCRETFETAPSEDYTYCSYECYVDRPQVSHSSGEQGGVAGD